MTPLELGAVLLQFSFFLIAGWPLGRVIARSLGDVTRRTEDEHITLIEYRFGAPERILFALVGAVAWAVVLMVAHIATGGWVFDTPAAVPLLTVALGVWEWRRYVRRPETVGPPEVLAAIRWRPIPVVAAAVILVGLYVVPMVVAGSSVRSGDSPWHLGWTEQLLAGESRPTGPAPEFAHNAYPWGVHAVIATMTRLVPGTAPLDALNALHLIIVLGIPLGAAVLARRIVPAAGWAAAAAATLIGGFGWIVARGAEFSTSPSGGRVGADLVVASPNSLYELFPPALPRELGLILVAAAGSALVVAGSSRRASLVAGAIVGLVGLVSVPMFVSAVVWMIAASWVAGRGGRVGGVTALAIPAVAVFALWAAPVVIDYLRFGGFVDITPRLGREWSLPAAVASWGLLFPLVLGGVFHAARRHRHRSRMIFAFGIGTMALLVLAIARGIFDWGLYGNATVLHQGRVWPPAHLLGAVFGGLALLAMYRGLRERSQTWSRVAVAGILIVGAASPALASAALTETMTDGRSGFMYDQPDVVNEQAFVQQAAAELGPDDVVSVEGSDELAFLLFQFSGARLADYDNPNLARNDLRIRFREPSERWQAVADGNGFEPDYLVVPVDTSGPALPSAVATGPFQGRSWALVRAGS